MSINSISTYGGPSTASFVTNEKLRSDEADLASGDNLTRKTSGRNNGIYGKYSTVIRNIDDNKAINGLINQTDESYFNELAEGM